MLMEQTDVLPELALAERATRSVLIVDDEPTMRVALAESLRRSGFTVTQASDGMEALERLGPCKPWLVLTDMMMPRMNGIEVIKEVKKRVPKTVVVIMTAHGTVETAVEAMKQGASDFLLKPFSGEALEQLLTRLLAMERPDAGPAIVTRLDDRPLLARDANMVRVLRMGEVVASSQATVLISGESGTGKEMLARFIHSKSPRSHRPFVAVNCAALPDGLLESELFGHERGAFTGALIRKIGKFEMAHTGTILLDEISEMNLNLQAKLLRVLQEREVDRVGGREPVRVDIRVLATTNRSLRREVEQGRFREDLYYRLNVFPLTLPPLRERPDDIPMLIEHSLRTTALRNGLPVPGISAEVVHVLKERPWKGNVRELENVVERAVLLAGGGAVELRHFSLEEDGPSLAPTVNVAHEAPTFSTGTIWEMERDLIVKTLEKFSGNRTHTAKALGISIRTLRNKLREYRQGSESNVAVAEAEDDTDS